MAAKNNIIRKAIPKLLILILFGGLSSTVQAQNDDNPHGKFTIDIDCAACHTSGEWVPAKTNMDFDHNTATNFELLGKHSVVSCRSCHLDMKFSKPEINQVDCASCHVDVHRGQFLQSCTSCHNMETFQVGDGRKIHSSTLFPLTGTHMQTSCASCHTDDKNGAFVLLDTDCFSCHEEDYNNTSTIDHQAQGFSTECQQCHTTLAWGPATFEHLQVSGGFPLLGAHNQITCNNCHRPPDFETIFATNDANDCFGCHESDYNREHGGSGFPTTCQTCHNVDSWGGAEIDHVVVSNGFDLIGAHDRIECSSCHQIPGYEVKFNATNENDCFGCHESDYNREHGGSGFPTTCQTCHNVDSWEEAEFEDHDSQFFPIFSGRHQGLWQSCQTCHDNPSTFTDFTCFNCHEHSQSNTDPRHDEVSGYVYDSQVCYNCHTDGRSDD